MLNLGDLKGFKLTLGRFLVSKLGSAQEKNSKLEDFVKIQSLILALGLLGLTACSSNDGKSSSPAAPAQTQQPQDAAKDTTPSGRQPNANPAASPSDEDVAKASFLKTFASGQKKWSLKNVVVDYVKSNGRGGAVKEKWSAKCTVSRPVTLNGAYPNLSFSLSGFDCGSSHSPSEFTYLQLITSNMVYTAHHIPAYPSEPNQFRLSLQSINNYGYFKWQSYSALNALTKDRVVFLDFIGEQKGDIDWRGNKNHFIQMSFQQSDDGRSEKLTMDYTLDENSGASTEINIKADLERTN